VRAARRASALRCAGARLEDDPDSVVDRLMAAGAKGVEVLWQIGYAEEPARPKEEGQATGATQSSVTCVG
jgi:hypothetical protein